MVGGSQVPCLAGWMNRATCCRHKVQTWHTAEVDRKSSVLHRDMQKTLATVVKEGTSMKYWATVVERSLVWRRRGTAYDLEGGEYKCGRRVL